jgi:DNA-binding PadR family transcriptional regulator
MHRRTPEAEGRRSSLIALFCLAGAPQSGYGVRRLIKQWRMEEYLSTSPATIYRSLARLEKMGLLESHTERNGRYPKSKVYAITAEGRLHYAELIRTEAQFRRTGYAISSFLGLGTRLDRAERIRLAETWMEAATQQVNELQARIDDHRPGKTYGKSYAEWLMLHHEAHQLRAEIAWLKHFRKLLTEGAA